MEELKKFVIAEMEKITSDEVYNLPPAAVQINAPRALQQVSLKSRLSTLTQVLNKIEFLRDEV